MSEIVHETLIYKVYAAESESKKHIVIGSTLGTLKARLSRYKSEFLAKSEDKPLNKVEKIMKKYGTSGIDIIELELFKYTSKRILKARLRWWEMEETDQTVVDEIVICECGMNVRICDMECHQRQKTHISKISTKERQNENRRRRIQGKKEIKEVKSVTF